MSILINDEKKLFHLQSEGASYIMAVNPQGFLVNCYWGRRLPEADYSYMAETRGHSSFEACEDNEAGYWVSQNCMRLEYPAAGRADVKQTALEVENPDGSIMADLRYKGYVLHEGKPGIKGLPATFETEAGRAETIEIILKDEVSRLEVSLWYSIWSDTDTVCRHAEIRNCGSAGLKLVRALSAGVDLPDRDFTMLSNYGGWANERTIEEHRLFSGVQGIYSHRGSSSHMHNPFLILKRPETTEMTGEAYGAALAYSGSYEAVADVDSYGMTRLLLGISPYNFKWQLDPAETFYTPEVCLAFSAEGLNGLSANFHTLLREHMCRSKYKNTRRPVLLNTWEGVYFGLNQEKIAAMAKSAAELGIELLVIDDGWFGCRDNDTSSLGDWYEDRSKLPEGVEGLARIAEEAGVKLGIWFEPEMISKNSELYRAHPDWVLCAEGRPVSQGRNQFVLDMSRADVRDYLFDHMSDIIRRGKISYIKWDFNRNFAEAGSRLLPPERQGEVYHRYVLGLYELLERLCAEFPDLLMEGCSGGGGRFDAGMLYYFPQTWTSDDTDAIMRLKIQAGTSLVYPLSSMSAHISAVPNHQTWRSVSFATRRDVAYTGSFGFELDPTKLSEEESREIRETAEDYKSFGDLFVTGRYFRLLGPDARGRTAWMFLAHDGSEALVTFASSDVSIEEEAVRLKLAGLEEEAFYRDEYSGRVYSGAALMHDGLFINGYGDRSTQRWRFRKE